MEYGERRNGLIIMMAISFLLGGCSTINPSKTAGSYEEGYRKGVSENMGTLVEKFNGNTFPYINGTWAQPLVQTVRVPGHVAGGFFYPEHDELVIITPGEWKKSGAFPLKEATRTLDEGTLCMEAVRIPGKDITVMPLTTESFQ